MGNRIRATLAQKNIGDKTLHEIIFCCATLGLVEELRLGVSLPRSSVE